MTLNKFGAKSEGRAIYLSATTQLARFLEKHYPDATKPYIDPDNERNKGYRCAEHVTWLAERMVTTPV